MAKATPNLNFSVLLPTEGSLKTFVTMLRSVYQNLVSVINGSLGFGDGTSSDNISGAWINVVAPVAPNTDFTVTHNLNRLPVGYWIMQKDRACDIYTGSVAATKTQLTLRATVASAVLRLFIVGVLLSLFCLGASAQTTSVTLQVTDAGAQSWNNGTWSVLLVSPPGINPSGPPFSIIGGGTVPNQSQSGSLNATGGASMTLTQSGVIAPTLSLWQFKVCPAFGIPFQCFVTSQTIAGASQTLTLTPPAISVSCGPNVSAYADAEAICGVGGLYYNLTSAVVRVCQTVSGNSCTAFANAGSGGTVPGGSNTQVQFNNSGAFGGSVGLTYSAPNGGLTITSQGAAGGLAIVNGGSSQTVFNLFSNAAGGVNNFILGGSTAGLHFNQGVANTDVGGKLTCATSTVTKTFAVAFTSTPVVLVFDETTKAGANLTAISNTAFTVSCTGATDALDYIVIGNPN